MPAWTALVAALLALAGGQPPVESLVGRPVASVAVVAEDRPVTDPALLDLVETRVGEPLALPAVRETIAHFVGLGRFENVTVQAVPEGAGVALRYELVPLHPIARVEFAGSPQLSDRRLRRVITDRFGPSPPATRLDDMARLLVEAYREEGYFEAAIQPRVVPDHQRERSTLVFDVDAGPRLLVSGVTVSGNAEPSLDAFRAEVGISAGEPYVRERIERRLADAVGGLRERGYYEATVDHELRAAPDGRSGEVRITVDGGPHVTVVFEGDSLPERVRRDLVPIQREGSVDEDLLEDSSKRIEDWLRAQGYRDARAPYTRTPRNGELAVVFRVARGERYRVDSVEIEGNASVPDAELRALLRTQAGEVFVAEQVEADVAALTTYYRRRGYAGVEVAPTELPVAGAPAPIPIVVRYGITEGVQTRVSSVGFAGTERVPEAVLARSVTLTPGQPYDPARLTADRDAVLLQYLDRGYQTASVEPDVRFSDDRTAAAIVFRIVEGPQVFVDHILIVGNERTRTETIRRELTLEPGSPLSYSAIAESQRRVSALGIFRRVRISEIGHGDREQRDILVTVEEAPATTLGYGVGLEGGRRLRQEEPDSQAQEQFEFSPRGFFEIGRRNLFGGNRSVNLFARATLRSRSLSTAPQEGEEPATGSDFRDYRVLGTFRSPRLLGTAADVLVTGFAEQGVRSSFNFNRRGARVELGRRLGRDLSLSARYALDRTELFEERFAEEDQPLIDRLFPQVRLSSLSTAVIRDTRDDPLAPLAGALVGLDGDVAARAIGSEVGFVKTFLQGFLYRRLPGRRPTVFAAGARLGLARGFSRDVPRVDGNGNPVLDADGRQIVDVVSDLPASERFFAGGDTTVRGYALDRLGTDATIDRNGFPRGGNALVVLNAELRVPVWRDLGAVAFVDAGNVFDRVSNVSLGDMKATTGFGVRYRSPIGPLRLDLGFKLDRRRFANGDLEPLTAWHISLGQAF